MDKQKIDEFVERYECMGEWEIAAIHAKEKDLTDEARAAIAAVMSKRGIDLAAIQERARHEDSARSEKEKIRTEKKRSRDARIYKAFLIIAVPIVVLGAFLRPERALETFVSSLVQVAGIALIGWLLLMLKRFLSRLMEKKSNP